MVGKELLFDNSLGFFEKVYVRVFGAPISGLRVRFRRLMPKVKKIIYRIKEGQEKRLNISIIDVGCGTGLFTYEIAKHFPGYNVVGVDSWAELIIKNMEIVRRAGIHNCTFKTEDAKDFNYKEEFDLAICIDNLEHIEDDSKVIRNIYNSLRKGGFALFHVPGFYRRWLFFSKKTNFDVKGHVRPGYTLEGIRQKILEEGFSIQEIHYTYGWLETVTNNISYFITGAERKNKYLYALVFPLLNGFAFFGQWSRPDWGAGVVAIAKKNGL